MNDQPIPVNTQYNGSSVKHLKYLTREEKKTFLDSFDNIFCDCDGVIWHTLHKLIPDSAETINYLRRIGKQITFVTNNSIIPEADQLRKFAKSNIEVEKQDIIHPAQTVCDYLKSINFDGLIYCLASSSFKNVLLKAGFQLVQEKDRIIKECVQDLRSAIYSSDPVKAVVIDVDFNLTAAKLMRAHVHLKNEDCLFIGGAADTLIPFGGADVIGPGPFITVVEQSSKRIATILGKPGKDLGELLKRRFQLVNPRRTLFIGDSLTSDVEFGKMCGFQTLLIANDAMIENIKMETAPDYVANCLADLNEIN